MQRSKTPSRHRRHLNPAPLGTDFYDVYTGVGARRIRETFDMMRNFAPAILFVDEVRSSRGWCGNVCLTAFWCRRWFAGLPVGAVTCLPSALINPESESEQRCCCTCSSSNL